MKRANDKEELDTVKKVKIGESPSDLQNQGNRTDTSNDHHFVDVSTIDDELDQEDLVDELVSSQENNEKPSTVISVSSTTELATTKTEEKTIGVYTENATGLRTEEQLLEDGNLQLNDVSNTEEQTLEANGELTEANELSSVANIETEANGVPGVADNETESNDVPNVEGNETESNDISAPVDTQAKTNDVSDAKDDNVESNGVSATEDTQMDIDNEPSTEGTQMDIDNEPNVEGNQMETNGVTERGELQVDNVPGFEEEKDVDEMLAIMKQESNKTDTELVQSTPEPASTNEEHIDIETIVIDDESDDNDEQVKLTKPTKEVAPPPPAIMTVKRHPVRQSRSKVTTYNDILNSAEPNTFESDFRSEDDEDINSTIPEYHSELHRKLRRTVSNSPRASATPTPKSRDFYRNPLGKRRFLKTGFVYDTAMSYHATPDPMEIHPEDPSRIFRIFNIIERHRLLQECQRIESRRATKEEILLVHSIVHYRKLRATANLKSRAEYMAMENHYDSIYLNSNSFESALYAVGSLINLLEAVVTDTVKNAFAIIRPPGHHAEIDIPMGFCLFNNVAIATRACMRKLNVKKILILDWDIHFGNGTQSIFSEDPNVLYISLHRFEGASFYPSDVKGAATYTGYGKGEGRTVNIPWPCSGLTDADYLHAFREVVMPIANEFDPDVVIVSAGFDAALNDPIGKCNVTPAGYGQMTHMLKSLARGKMVIALEGGYNLDSIAVSAVACMNVLLGESPEPIEYGLIPKKECFQTVELVKSVQKKYWKCFN